MSLNPQEQETLALAVEKLEQKIVEDGLTGEGLETSRAEAEKEDNIYKKEWDKYHTWILNYEREIEGLSGEYIAAPFSIQDLEEQVENRGRLYQGTVSSDPKVIPEMVGAGLASDKKAPNEIDDLHPQFYQILDFLVNGIGSPGTATIGDTGYAPGDTEIIFSTAVSPNTWYLGNLDVLIKIGAVSSTPAGGSCSLPEFLTESECTTEGGVWETTDPSWTGTVEEVYGDNAMASGSFLGPWLGYSNSERSSKSASTTTQRLMDALVAQLNVYVDAWIVSMTKTKTSVNNNDAPNMNEPDRTTTNENHDYLTTYRLTTPIQDGDPGIDGLEALMASRTSFIGTRPVTIKTAKAEYYAQRTNFTKMRSNIQAGSLTRMRYFEEFQVDFPAGGSQEERKRLQEMNTLLAED